MRLRRTAVAAPPVPPTDGPAAADATDGDGVTLKRCLVSPLPPQDWTGGAEHHAAGLIVSEWGPGHRVTAGTPLTVLGRLLEGEPLPIVGSWNADAAARTTRWLSEDVTLPEVRQ